MLMLRKWVRLPRLSLLRRVLRRPSRQTLKKAAGAGLLTAALVGVFYWGRCGGLAEARAQSPQPPSLNPNLPLSAQRAQPGHVVAYIYGNTPITREELGEYLIERLGAERIDFLVNR